MRKYSALLFAGALLAGCDEADAVRGGHDTLHAVAREEHEEHEGHGHGHEDEHEEEHEHEHAHPAVSREAVEHVLVMESTSAGQATEALGIVDAHEKMGHHEEAMRELREEAAALGADAVIGVEFHHGESHAALIHLSGLAVRFRDLRRDEPYDVLGKLEVAADMHRQDAAMRELQRQGGALGADLIINIEYEHGDAGNQKTHLTGTAIRYRSSLDHALGMP